jgi:EAL domain-containing protein (putative c-di-GMP-specific phosphodiesterase class I)
MKLAQSLQATGSSEYLAFNLSRWAFVDPEMLHQLKRELEETGVDPQLIVVEMTETSALSDITSAERFMQGLRATGCRFALDDFGVGYSSFHHLKRLPVDFLKIDGSFVRDITHNRADREIVSAMVRMAEGLGLQTVAEAVHSEAVLNIAREIGVHFAQGYWIARPAPASRLLSRSEDGSVPLTIDVPKQQKPGRLQAA